MEFDEYVYNCGVLFGKAVRSGVEPAYLRRLGGCIAVAGHKADAIHVEKNGYYIFDRERGWKEQIDLIGANWRAFRAEIVNEIDAGEPPTKSLENVLRRYATYPHTPEQIRKLLEVQQGPTGYDMAWIIELRFKKDRWERNSEVMGSGFGAVFSMVTLIATAENWQKAKPDEWDKALVVGKAGIFIEGVAGAVGSAREARVSKREGTSAQPANAPPAIVAPATTEPPQAKAPPAGQPGAAQRGLTSKPAVTKPSAATRGTAPASRGTPPPTAHAPPPPPAKPAQSNVDDLNVDKAIAEGADYGPRTSDRRKSVDGNPSKSDERLAQLNQLGANMTAAQRRAVFSLIGKKKFPPALRTLWDKCSGNDAQLLVEVGRLANSKNPADQKEAKVRARSIYRNRAGRFWTAVNDAMKSDAALKQQFRDAGLQFDPNNKRKAPFWKLPDGRNEVLSIDHFEQRIMDNPTRCVDSANLVLSPATENSVELEGIRNTDRFQSH